MRDETFIGRVARLRKDVDDYKKAQIIGSSSVQGYKNQSSNTWDATWLPTGDMFNRSTSYFVVFKASNQIAPFGSLSVKAEFDGVPHDPTQRSSLNRNGVSIDDLLIRGAGITNISRSDYIIWRVAVTATEAVTTVRLKFYVNATDAGLVERLT